MHMGGDMDDICLGSCSGMGHMKMCTFTFAVDLYASELGYFKVEECGDMVNPTLGIEKNVHYKFVQNDVTNYRHPLGFMYGMDHGGGGGHDDHHEMDDMTSMDDMPSMDDGHHHHEHERQHSLFLNCVAIKAP